MQSMNPETAVTNTHGHFNQLVFAVYMWIHACGPSMEEPAVVSHSTGHAARFPNLLSYK